MHPKFLLGSLGAGGCSSIAETRLALSSTTFYCAWGDLVPTSCATCPSIYLYLPRRPGHLNLSAVKSRIRLRLRLSRLCTTPDSPSLVTLFESQTRLVSCARCDHRRDWINIVHFHHYHILAYPSYASTVPRKDQYICGPANIIS